MNHLQQIIIRNKKTQKYYHPKTKNWLTEEPTDCLNSINKLYLDYDPASRKNISNTFKKIPVTDLEIIQRKFVIVKQEEENIEAEDVFQNRLEFQKYQNNFGYTLPDFIKDLHTKNAINDYKFIARLFNHERNAITGVNYIWLNNDTARQILSKIKHQGLKKTDVKFRNPLIALKDAYQLLTLKLTAGEHIHCFEEIEKIYKVWMKMNLLK
jgi:hypothetical protein